MADLSARDRQRDVACIDPCQPPGKRAGCNAHSLAPGIKLKRGSLGEAGSDPTGVNELAAIIIPEHQAADRPRMHLRGHKAGDDKLLPRPAFGLHPIADATDRYGASRRLRSRLRDRSRRPAGRMPCSLRNARYSARHPVRASAPIREISKPKSGICRTDDSWQIWAPAADVRGRRHA